MSTLILTIIIFTLATLKSPTPTHAFSLGDALKLNPNSSVQDEFPSFASLISSIIPNAYILAGIILLFLLVFGGFTIVTSGSNPEQTQKGTQAIGGAIIGFVVIFASYWIIQIIQVLTGINILNSSII